MLLTVFAVFCCLYWLVQAYIVARSLISTKYLRDYEHDTGRPYPKVSVIVPARNEEIEIEKAVKSRLSDDYPNLEIILVDDRSTDGTPGIVDELARSDARVKPVHIDALPDGWVGKLYAMHRGAQAATGEWLLFSDADVYTKPGTLKKAVAYCQAGGFGHLTVLPELKTSNIVLDSVISFFMKLLVVAGRFYAVENERSSAAMGAGAFNLVRREFYEKINGFESMKQELADDMMLGITLKKAGARPSVVNGSDYVSVPFYKSLKDMALGTERATFTSLGNFSFIRVAAACILMFILELSPLLLLIPFGNKPVFYTGLALTAVCLLMSVSVNRWTNRPALPSFLFPLGLLLFVYMGIRAGYLGYKRGGIYWRGTFYSTEELKKGKQFSFK